MALWRESLRLFKRRASRRRKGVLRAATAWSLIKVSVRSSPVLRSKVSLPFGANALGRLLLMSRFRPVLLLVADGGGKLSRSAAEAEIQAVSFHQSQTCAAADWPVGEDKVDALVIDVSAQGCLDLLRSLAARPERRPLLVALAGAGALPGSLEQALLRLELMGADLALPLPIDAEEIADAVLFRLSARRASRAG